MRTATLAGMGFGPKGLLRTAENGYATEVSVDVDFAGAAA